MIQLNPSQSLALVRLRPSDVINEPSEAVTAFFRACYICAVEEHIINKLQILAEVKGQEEQGVFTYENEGLCIVFRKPCMALKVTLGGKTVVCRNDVPLEAELVPVGNWVDRMLAAYDRIEAEQNEAARNAELARKHEILTLLAGEV